MKDIEWFYISDGAQPNTSRMVLVHVLIGEPTVLPGFYSEDQVAWFTFEKPSPTASPVCNRQHHAVAWAEIPRAPISKQLAEARELAGAIYARKLGALSIPQEMALKAWADGDIAADIEPLTAMSKKATQIGDAIVRLGDAAQGATEKLGELLTKPIDVVCDNCKCSISVNEMKCPNCGTEYDGVGRIIAKRLNQQHQFDAAGYPAKKEP